MRSHYICIMWSPYICIMQRHYFTVCGTHLIYSTWSNCGFNILSLICCNMMILLCVHHILSLFILHTVVFVVLFVVYLYLFINTVVYLTYCCCSACLSACELSFKSRCCICLIIMPACIIRLSRLETLGYYMCMTFTIYLLHGTTYLLLSDMLSLFSLHTVVFVTLFVVYLYLFFNTVVYLTCSCSVCLSACELSFKSRCCIFLLLCQRA